MDDLGNSSILPPSVSAGVLDEYMEATPLGIDIDEVLDPKPTLSKLVTFKLPKHREALKRLDQPQSGFSDTPSKNTVELPSCFRKASTSGDVVFTSKDSYVAWILEDPDPHPPAHRQGPLPSQLTAFKFSGLYNTGECMKGCSGPPPGTGCPICEPVDFKSLAQVHGVDIKLLY